MVFSTHVDTVPPYVPLAEDDVAIRGRGSCDAKGLAAAMVAAAERLAGAGERRVGLLFLVGEENGSDGAIAAADLGPKGRYLINGEPTENRSRSAEGHARVDCRPRPGGAFRLPGPGGKRDRRDARPIERIRACRCLAIPARSLTLNLGTISGGVAPNVIHTGIGEADGPYVEPTGPLKLAIAELLAPGVTGIFRWAAVSQGRRTPGMGRGGRELCQRLHSLASWGEGTSSDPVHPHWPHGRGAHPQDDLLRGVDLYVRWPPTCCRRRHEREDPRLHPGATAPWARVRSVWRHPWFEVTAVAASATSAGNALRDVVRGREQSPLTARSAI